MSKLILFSQPQPDVLEKLSTELFTKDGMTIAYMPSDGASASNPKYESFWREFVTAHGASLIPVDNSLRGDAVKAETEKILRSDALILTGGNTFTFLKHLQESGLGETIREFADMNKPIAGFSAGAIILSPTIAICNLPSLDSNEVGLDDLTGLGLIDFEVYPHYDEAEHKEVVDAYAKTSSHEVKRVRNDEVVIINS